MRKFLLLFGWMFATVSVFCATTTQRFDNVRIGSKLIFSDGSTMTTAATGGGSTYTNGSGLLLTGNVFSLDTASVSNIAASFGYLTDISLTINGTTIANGGSVTIPTGNPFDQLLNTTNNVTFDGGTIGFTNGLSVSNDGNIRLGGNGNRAQGNPSIVIGGWGYADGANSVSIQGGMAIGAQSLALGQGGYSAFAFGAASLAIGGSAMASNQYEMMIAPTSGGTLTIATFGAPFFLGATGCGSITAYNLSVRDSSGLLSFDGNSRIFYANDGTTTVLNWSNAGSATASISLLGFLQSITLTNTTDSAGVVTGSGSVYGIGTQVTASASVAVAYGTPVAGGSLTVSGSTLTYSPSTDVAGFVTNGQQNVNFGLGTLTTVTDATATNQPVSLGQVQGLTGSSILLNFWSASNSTVVVTDKALRPISYGIPGLETNSVAGVTNNQYIGYCSPALGLTSLRAGIYYVTATQWRSGSGGPACSLAAELYLTGSNGVDKIELTAVAGTGAQVLSASPLQLIYAVTISSNTTCLATDSIRLKFKCSGVSGTTTVHTREGTLSLPVPSTQYLLASQAGSYLVTNGQTVTYATVANTASNLVGFTHPVYLYPLAAQAWGAAANPTMVPISNGSTIQPNQAKLSFDNLTEQVGWWQSVVLSTNLNSYQIWYTAPMASSNVVLRLVYATQTASGGYPTNYTTLAYATNALNATASVTNLWSGTFTNVIPTGITWFGLDRVTGGADTCTTNLNFIGGAIW